MAGADLPRRFLPTTMITEASNSERPEPGLFDRPVVAYDEDAAFDRANPDVYQSFVLEAIRVREAGFDHYSARTIVHVMRHHRAIQDGSILWKINDHISPYLGRRLMRERPEFKGFFETRRLSSGGDE